MGPEYPGRLLAGVMVMASADMARRISADVLQINVLQPLISALEADRDAGVDLAADMVPVGRYTQMATKLRAAARGRRPLTDRAGEAGR